MAADQEFVTVGRLGRPRGLSGEIFVTPLTDFPERFVNIKEIFVSRKNDWEKKKVVSSKFVSGRPVLLFENINSPEQASRLTNRFLAIPKNMVMELPEGSNYIYDLIGCQVIDEKTGEAIGQITDVELFPANDVYMIETNDGRMKSLPVIERYVKKVDADAKKVFIDPSGMIEQ